jgi:hypothetical protein
MREGIGIEYERESILRTNNYGIERLIVGCLISSIAGLATYVGLCGLDLTVPIAVLIVVLLCVVGVILLAHRLPRELDGIRIRKPWVSTVWLVIAAAALLQTTRFSIFMLDPSQTQYSLFPGETNGLLNIVA